MRFQLLLVGLATAICLMVGGARLRDKIVSTQSYASAEAAGNWIMITGDYNGLRAFSRSGGNEILPFSSVQVNNQAWDLSPDLRRAAVVDNYSYSGNPGLKVYATRRTDPIAETAPTQGNTFYCPLFDVDGSLLFLDAQGISGSLRRLEVPKHDGANPTSRVTTVRTATALKYDDCFERSEDGDWLAWFGTDSQIHLARKSASGGYLSDHKQFPGVEFALSADGSRLAVRDGTGISVIDVHGGNRQLVTSDIKYQTLIDFSPDGQWLSALGTGSFSTRTIVAFRVRDGEVVSIGANPNYYYYPTPGQALARWRAKP